MGALALTDTQLQDEYRKKKSTFSSKTTTKHSESTSTTAQGIYQITPKQGAVVFESKIAPTTVNGMPDAAGGATQSLVLDRSQFTLPVKTGSIVIKK
jgi:hypothetical protein